MLTRTLLIALSFWGSIVSQSALAGYPTVWKVVNHTEFAGYLECRHWNDQMREFHRQVEPHSEFDVTWSDHNDGVGLIAPSWTCGLGRAKRPLTHDLPRWWFRIGRTFWA